MTRRLRVGLLPVAVLLVSLGTIACASTLGSPSPPATARTATATATATSTAHEGVATSTAGASPAPASPLPTPGAVASTPVAPARVPTVVAAPSPVATPSVRLKYLWPTGRPDGFVVDPVHSRADATAFELRLAPPGGGQFHVTVVGGGAVRTTPAAGARPVTVRGKSGRELNTGAGSAVYWEEEGVPYGVVTGQSLADALRVADGLEVVALDAWMSRLGRSLRPGGMG